MPVRSPSQGCEVMARMGGAVRNVRALRGADQPGLRGSRIQSREEGRQPVLVGLRTGECRPWGTREAASALWPLLSSANPIFAPSAPPPTPPDTGWVPKPHGATKSRDTLFIFHFSSPGSGFSFFLKSHFPLQPRGRVPSASCPLSDPTSSPSPPPGAAVGLGPSGQTQGPSLFPHVSVLLCIRSKINGGLVSLHF